MKQKRKNWSLLIGVGLMALVAWSALTSAAESVQSKKGHPRTGSLFLR